MTDFQSDYAALASAARGAAVEAELDNVCQQHLRAAEAWERLAEEEKEWKLSAGSFRLRRNVEG